jgi:hypothetical protein
MRLLWQHALSCAPRKLVELDSISFGRDLMNTPSQYAANKSKDASYLTLFQLPNAHHIWQLLLLSIHLYFRLVPHLQMQTWTDCQTASNGISSLKYDVRDRTVTCYSQASWIILDHKLLLNLLLMAKY